LLSWYCHPDNAAYVQNPQLWRKKFLRAGLNLFVTSQKERARRGNAPPLDGHRIFFLVTFSSAHGSN
jgi:hypothetical protein